MESVPESEPGKNYLLEPESISGSGPSSDFGSGAGISSPSLTSLALLPPAKNNWSLSKNNIFGRGGNEANKIFLPGLEQEPNKNYLPEPKTESAI